MNDGLINPNGTKHHLNVGERICPNGAANYVIVLQMPNGLIILKDIKNNPSNILKHIH